MLGGGRDRELLIDLNPDGNLQGSEAMGCHRGDYEFYNVINPQPGMKYYHGLRTESGIRRGALRGWSVVPPDDPARMGNRVDPNFQAAGLDGYQTAGETVLMHMPEERYRQLCALREAANERMRQDNARGFTESDTAQSLQERYKQAVYFKAPGHGAEQY